MTIECLARSCSNTVVHHSQVTTHEETALLEEGSEDEEGRGSGGEGQGSDGEEETHADDDELLNL